MRYKKLFAILLSITTLWSCKKDFLQKLPLDQLLDENYWSNENNVRTFAWGFYPNFFSGYGSGYTWGKFFSGQSLNDDFAPSIPTPFVKVPPAAAAGTGWDFSWVRKANIMLNRVQRVPLDKEPKEHWTGIARFFRGMAYFDLVKSFGDVPWYDKEMTETDPDLYKPRDPRVVVMDKVLEDFKYAAQYVRESDGKAGLVVNRNIVLGFMSRIFLFEGTWLKYHGINPAKSTEYLQQAKWAAEQVINSNKFSINDSYRTVFNSVDLAGKTEVMLYREYSTGNITHSLHSYVNKEGQSGTSKNAIESFLCNDGLPIAVSAKYKGDKGIANVMGDRDPRMIETFVQEYRINGVTPVLSTSGYAVRKFLNDALVNATEGSSNLNITDAPVLRFGEVLLNYAEATAELGGISQADLDKSINKLRARPGINMPPLQVMGDQPAVNGVVYDDPKRDATVSSLLWEIRRERRTELMFEGFRLDDLRRWKKLDYTTSLNTDVNRGAWVSRAQYPNMIGIHIENDAAEGYIIPAWTADVQRVFSDPKVYLNPLAIDQMKLYADHGSELAQNPGWK